MKTYHPEIPLISLHIPKMAGTSFKEALQTWFGSKLLLHYFDEKNAAPPAKHNLYKGILKKRPKHGLCIHGHFNRYRNIGIENYYPNSRQYITILRDPFETHVSNYFYTKKLMKNGVTFEKDISVAEQQMDVMRYFRKHKRSYLRFFLPEGISINNYQSVLDNNFIFIGIAERLQDSVDKLAVILGFKPITISHENTSPRDEPIPEFAREEFMRDNELEMAIYSYALNRFGQ